MNSIPKGRLLIIGGHEEKTFTGVPDSELRSHLHMPHFDILSKLMNSLPHEHYIIEIIATASSIPAEMEKTYMDAFKAAGYHSLAIMRIEDASEANNPELVNRIHYAHAVFFTGGDQRQLCNVIRGTEVLKAIQHKYMNDPHFMVAGTSAGAMSIPNKIIERGVLEETLLKSDLIMNEGLGLMDHVIVDTHFVKRGRFGRLALGVVLNRPNYTGIGLGEDGALLITNGNEAACIGSGLVMIIDGSKIGATNAQDADDYTPIAIENLQVHILVEGCGYLFKEKKMITRVLNIN